MFICLCHAVTDRDITAAIEAGHHDVAALMENTKVATQCGSCLNSVIELVEDYQQTADLVLTESGHIGAPQIYGL